MPAIYFDIALPGGEELRCYSPSLIVTELLTAGAHYPVFEFMARSRAALEIASERVRVKYGFTCSAALDTLGELERKLSALGPEASVSVLGFAPDGSGPRKAP